MPQSIPHPGRRFVATSLLAVTALALSACAPEGGAPHDSNSAKQQRDFAALYEQDIAWAPCEEVNVTTKIEEKLLERGTDLTGLRCGFVTAPLDWDAPENTETIQLAITHLPAAGDSPAIGTLLMNPGGPGAPGVTLPLAVAAEATFAEVRESYDLLGFDPRGIGSSTPVHCETDSSITEVAISQCSRQDPLTHSMGTVQVARDMELMRHLMGDDKLHYLGYSYGTVIGATYATLFPERNGRLILDSGWDSDWSSPTSQFQQGEAIAHEIVNLIEGCGTDCPATACPITTEPELVTALSTLEQQPLTAADGTAVTKDMVYGYLAASLYQQRDGRTSALDLFARVTQGEQDAIDELAEQMAGGGASVQTEGLIVLCLSSPPDPDVAGLVDYVREHGIPELMGGPEVNDETLKPLIDLSCDGVPDKGEDHLKFENASDSTMLVIGVTGDHATPYQAGLRLAEQLGNTVMVSLDGVGHTVSYAHRSSCVDQISTNFLVRGELPPEGTVCTDD